MWEDDGGVEDDRDDVEEEVEVDLDVEEVVEVDGTPSPPAAREPVALVLVFGIEADTEVVKKQKLKMR